MRKVVFQISTNVACSLTEEPVEFDDDATDEEIGEALLDWVCDRGFLNWYEEE